SQFWILARCSFISGLRSSATFRSRGTSLSTRTARFYRLSSRFIFACSLFDRLFTGVDYLFLRRRDARNYFHSSAALALDHCWKECAQSGIIFLHTHYCVRTENILQIIKTKVQRHWMSRTPAG